MFNRSRPSLDEIVNKACCCAEPVNLEIEAVLRIVSEVMMQDRDFRAGAPPVRIHINQHASREWHAASLLAFVRT